jgi:hypothetical protein
LMIIEGIVATGERRERALEGKRRNTRERWCCWWQQNSWTEAKKKKKYSCVYMMMTIFALQLKLASWSQGECHPCNWHLCCTSNAISPLWLLPAHFSRSFFFLFNGVLGVDAYLVHEISLFSSSRDFLEKKWDFHRFRVAVL